MKLVAGVALAGAVAAGVAVSLSEGDGGSMLPAGAPPVKGPPKFERYAFTNVKAYLDGPRLEAMSGNVTGQVDDAGNLFVMAGARGALRCIRAEDGMVQTITADDRYPGSLSFEEGPAACLPYCSPNTSIGAKAITFFVRGSPLAGEDKGWVYVWTGNFQSPRCYKVFRSNEHDGRWWARRVDLGGKGYLQTHPDGGLLMISGGTVYRYDEKTHRLGAPLLKATDYTGKTKHWRDGKNLSGAETIVCATDGSFYLNYYNQTYSRGQVYHVSADKSKVDLIAQSGPDKMKCHDGSAMNTGWFGGPLLVGYTPDAPDCLYFTAIDDAWVRRYKDGRISSLCKDGEWREFPSRKATAVGEMKPYARFKDNEPPLWGRGYTFGPKGSRTFYQTYWSMCHTCIYRISPVDLGKPTVGPLVGGK